MARGVPHDPWLDQDDSVFRLLYEKSRHLRAFIELIDVGFRLVRRSLCGRVETYHIIRILFHIFHTDSSAVV